MFWLALLHERTSNISTFLYVKHKFQLYLLKRHLGLPTRLDHCLFQDGCQIVVGTDAGLTGHTDWGFAENKYCFNLVFIMVSDLVHRYAIGRLSFFLPPIPKFSSAAVKWCTKNIKKSSLGVPCVCSFGHGVGHNL